MAVFQLGEIRANESNCQITKTYSGNEVGWIRNVCILYQNFGTLDSLLHFSRELRVFIHIQPSTKHFHICICHLALFSVQHLFACLFSTDKQFSGIVNYMFWFVLLERSIHEDNQLGEYFCCCPKLLSSNENSAIYTTCAITRCYINCVFVMWFLVLTWIVSTPRAESYLNANHPSISLSMNLFIFMKRLLIHKNFKAHCFIIWFF